MADKSNQHFVPQFYFRAFSQDGKSICVLDRKSGKLINYASIKGQASKKHFYGEREIEDELSRIEGEFSHIFNKLKTELSFRNISKYEYLVFLENIALQKSRSLSARTKSKKYQDHIHRLSLEIEINKDESLCEEEKEKRREEIKKCEADPSNYQVFEMSIAIETSKSLQDLHPLVLLNKTTRPFIFGDAPAIYTNPQLASVKLQGVLGTQTPGLLVYYPINSKTSILLVDLDAYKIKGGTKETLKIRNLSDIALLNKLQLHNASNAVYFSDFKYSSYVANLWKQEKYKLRGHNIGKVIEASSVDNTESEDGFTSELLHCYEPQLALIPKLSFLKYEEISEQNYHFNQRADSYL